MRFSLKVFLVISVLLCVTSVSLADPTVMVTSYVLTPSVLMPGDSAELKVTITNTELTSTTTTTAYYGSLPTIVSVETNAARIENMWIVPDGDGSNIIKVNDNIPDIGDLSPGSSVTVSFLLTAHENLTAGLYYPVFHVDVKSYQDVQYPIPIRVSDLSASLLSKNIPSKISTSGSTPITLTAVNKKEINVEDVTITAEINGTLRISPQTIYIGTMEPETSEDIMFSLQPITTGFFNTTFTMTYRIGENIHTDSLQVPIEVIENSDVSPIINFVPKTMARNSTERVSLEVYNAKTEDITGAIVIPETDLSISPSQYFIGAMGPDDVFSASFDVTSEDVELGNHTISFKVIFKQDNEYFESPVITRSIQILNPPPVETEYTTGILAASMIILLVVIGLFYMMRKRSRR